MTFTQSAVTDKTAAAPALDPKAQPATPQKDKVEPPIEPQAPPVEAPASPAAPLALPRGPQPLVSLHSATVTDPDSGARVTTRSDLLMVIDYTTGDKVVQDSDGTRATSYASGGFVVESAGLPTIRGGSDGVALEPMPGTKGLATIPLNVA